MNSSPAASRSDAVWPFLRALYPEWLERVRPSLEAHLEQEARPSPDGTSLPDDPATPGEQLRVMTSLPRRSIPAFLEHPVAVILAGGKGTRMAVAERQKALCPILGRPALARTLETCRAFGIRHFILIVGYGYQEVLRHVGSGDPGITFLYQEQQLGTGHAARLAARYLQTQGYRGDVLVVMGDKFITRRGFARLLRDHAARRPHLTISTASKRAWPDSGRVLMDAGGQIQAIIEKPDLVQSRLLWDFYHWPGDPVPSQALTDLALRYWNRPEKWKKILGPAFWEALQTQPAIPKNCGLLPKPEDALSFEITPSLRISGEDIEEQCDQVNISVYIFQSAPFYQTMERLHPNNAQGELYLTDAVQELTRQCHSQGYCVLASAMPHDYDIMGFNTREELDFIERSIQEKGLLDEDETGPRP
ncbi:MAG: sugar phosphate nucleotidyltransferase [bacterium]